VERVRRIPQMGYLFSELPAQASGQARARLAIMSLEILGSASGRVWG
jgi:hypothetical protein